MPLVLANTVGISEILANFARLTLLPFLATYLITLVAAITLARRLRRERPRQAQAAILALAGAATFAGAFIAALRPGATPETAGAMRLGIAIVAAGLATATAAWLTPRPADGPQRPASE